MSQKKEKQRRRERREIQAALAEQLRLLAKRAETSTRGIGERLSGWLRA
jgi:hypothetical protein